MLYNITAQVTDLPHSDEQRAHLIHDALERLLAAGLRGPCISPAPRLPAGGDERRTEIIVSVEADTLRQAMDHAAATLEEFGLAEIRATSTQEFDAETEEIGQGATMTTAEVAEHLGITPRGVMQMVTRGTLTPAHRHERVTVFDRREIDALTRRRATQTAAG